MNSEQTFAPERDPANHTLRVIKIGGSLLDWPDLKLRFFSWLSQQTAARNLLVVGGGDIVEAVRILDRVHSLDSVWTHHLCIDLLHSTTLIAQQVLGVTTLLETAAQLREWTGQNIDVASHVFNPCALASPRSYIELTSSGTKLPESWDTTSDSLALVLAQRVHAELVLLKSTMPESPLGSLEQLSIENYVDASFPQLYRQESISSLRFVDLRSDEFHQVKMPLQATSRGK